MTNEPVPDKFLPIVGNRKIEDAAIAWVIDLERGAGRDGKDMRSAPGFPADISSPPRTIEVKAVGLSVRGADLPVEATQLARARADPNFWIYVVDNVAQGNIDHFRLKALGGEQLARLLQRVREKRYYELPLPVAELDLAPGKEAL